jgi:hypothetical protein
VNDSTTISGEKFSTGDLELLMGSADISNPKDYICSWQSSQKSALASQMLKSFCELCLDDCDMDEFRLALIRIQVDAELKMLEDIQRYQQGAIVAQVIEILRFKSSSCAKRGPGRGRVRLILV